MAIFSFTDGNLTRLLVFHDQFPPHAVDYLQHRIGVKKTIEAPVFCRKSQPTNTILIIMILIIQD